MKRTVEPFLEEENEINALSMYKQKSKTVDLLRPTGR